MTSSLFATHRRTFLQQLLAAGSALPLLARAAAAAPAIQFCLGQWTFHRAFKGEPGIAKRDTLEFPSMAGELGFAGVDYSGQLWAEQSRDPKFLAELRRRAGDAGVRNVLILVDHEGLLGAADSAARQEAIERHTRWLEVAATLGCIGLRVNPDSDPMLPADEQARLLADGVAKLATAADARGLDVLLENHGEGLRTDGAWIAGVVKAVNHPRCGTLPDFGNFQLNRKREEWHDRYAGVAAMLPFAKALCAKAHQFDAEGKEIHTDYERMLRLAADVGFKGWIEVEYEGPNAPKGAKPTRAAAAPLASAEGARATKRLVETTWAAIHAGGRQAK